MLIQFNTGACQGPGRRGGGDATAISYPLWGNVSAEPELEESCSHPRPKPWQGPLWAVVTFCKWLLYLLAVLTYVSSHSGLPLSRTHLHIAIKLAFCPSVSLISQPFPLPTPSPALLCSWLQSSLPKPWLWGCSKAGQSGATGVGLFSFSRCLPQAHHQSQGWRCALVVQSISLSSPEHLCWTSSHAQQCFPPADSSASSQTLWRCSLEQCLRACVAT